MVHQARCLELTAEPRVLVEAPTGAGKTWAGAAPLIDAAAGLGEGAIFVYPTNALADDQTLSLADVLQRAGHLPGTIAADGSIDVAGADVLLWRVHAGAIEETQKQIGGRSRGQALSRLLERLPAKPVWVVTNPDTLYLLCTARYALSPQLWSRLGATRTVVFDEFHLYRGPTLVRALVMVELARELLGVERVRILSATLPESVRELLVERFGFVAVGAQESSEGRVVQHDVALSVEVAEGHAATDRIMRAVCEQLPVLRAERGPDSVPLLALRQSVLATIRLEDDLVAQGLSRDEIGIYRGLSSRAVRTLVDKTVVLGTSALEVGVDFRTSRLIFEALSATSFAQRLGRVGRHKPGEALFLTNARVAGELTSLLEYDRPALLRAIASLLTSDDDLTAFATSPFAGAVAAAAFDALCDRARSLGAPDEFFTRVLAAHDSLRSQLGTQELPPLELMSRAARARLRSSVGFRGGEGTVEVFDVRERGRRGRADLAVYELDLATFFQRAVWSNAPDGSCRPAVTGYGERRHLALSLNTALPANVGLHAPRGNQLELRINGIATAWESLLREREHLVGLFPASLRNALSWREDVFESDDGRIALLDDDAVVAAFLYWQRRSRVAHG
jgi:CRISPR-associated helicase Cas3